MRILAFFDQRSEELQVLFWKNYAALTITSITSITSISSELIALCAAGRAEAVLSVGQGDHILQQVLGEAVKKLGVFIEEVGPQVKRHLHSRLKKVFLDICISWSICPRFLHKEGWLVVDMKARPISHGGFSDVGRQIMSRCARCAFC
ncbi:hypothetical protein D9758_014263 [Tetrapyrgos nigripes]|uniref:Uncharacterized protein n=1 Tax=Tetrapyrgos nigripes TaxID=182062 RepID=A0A8H5CCJ3_9AGAR|nr:hypothetical protein D9758_014263 [Tetrapyrgos nigripes]